MNMHTLAAGGSVINLNGPGDYKSWGIFYLSVANLVVIGIMVALFALALLLPFPGKHSEIRDADTAGDSTAGRSADITADTPMATDPDADMWTARVRRRA